MTRPTSVFRSAIRCIVGITLFSLASCASKPPPQPAAPVHTDTISYWEGDGVAGPPKIVIDLSDQVARYFKGGQLVGVSQISSGREGYGTTTGRFRVTEKDIDHRSSIYGSYVDAGGQIVNGDVDVRKDPKPPGTRFLGASMRFFMRINGGIGMHEGYLPGVPASHGCIRMPTRMARIFYEATPHGTPVEVTGHGSVAPLRPPVHIEEHKPEASGSEEAKPDEAPAEAVAATPQPPTPPRSKKQPWTPFRREAKPPPVPRGTTLYLYE